MVPSLQPHSEMLCDARPTEVVPLGQSWCQWGGYLDALGNTVQGCHISRCTANEFTTLPHRVVDVSRHCSVLACRLALGVLIATNATSFAQGASIPKLSHKKRYI